MSDTIATINQQLDAETEKLRLHLTDLESQVVATKDELHRLENARSALNGNKNSRNKPAQKKNAKPAPTKAKVADLIESAIRKDGTLGEADLKVAVANQLVEDGFSKIGFSLRFKEALASDPLSGRHPATVVAD